MPLAPLIGGAATVATTVTNVVGTVTGAATKITSVVTKTASVVVGVIAKVTKALFSLGVAILDVVKNFTIFTAAAIAAATAGLVYFTAQEFETIDATVKLSRELNIATTALEGLQLAAGLTGSDAETLNRALRRLPKTLGDAARGLKTAQDGFTELGLDFRELGNLPVEESILRIADAVQNMGNVANRSAALTAIFGRQGQALTNFFNSGSEALRDTIQQARRLNGEFSALDFAGIETANDEILKLGISFRSVFKRIAVEVAPVVAVFANKLTNAIVQFRNETLPIIIDWGKRAFKAAQTFIVQFGPPTIVLIKTLVQGFGALATATVTAFNSIISAVVGFDTTGRNASQNFLDLFTRAVTGVTFVFTNLGQVVENVSLRLQIAWQKFTREVTKSVFLVKEFVAGFAGVGGLPRDLFLGPISERFNKLASDLKNTKNEIVSLQDELAKSNKKLANSYDETSKRVSNDIKNITETVKDLINVDLESVGLGSAFNPVIGAGLQNDQFQTFGGGRNTNFALRGIQQGSQEAFNAIANAQRGEQTVQQKQLAAQQEAVKVQEAQLKQLQNLNNVATLGVATSSNIAIGDF